MNQLRERYVAAVLRSIPEHRREDVDRELRAAIDDAVEARVGAGEAPEDAERSVVTDLGDPARLAADYSDRPLWLIGPTYYLAWQRTMRWLLAVIVPAAAVLNVVLRMVVGTDPVPALLGGLGVALVAALNVVFWATLGFVVAERTDYVRESDLAPLTRWKPEYLPATTSDRRFGLVETLGALAFQLVAVVAVVAIIQSQPAGILDSAAWTLALPVMAVLLAASMTFRIVRYRVGRWTVPLATINAALNAAFAVWWWWALWDLRILDPALAERQGIDDWLGPSARVTTLAVVAVCLWDAVAGFTAARRTGS